jgi:D-glycero-D-manno-heptose 1,7-bisphosphate phosphatase
MYTPNDKSMILFQIYFSVWIDTGQVINDTITLLDQKNYRVCNNNGSIINSIILTMHPAIFLDRDGVIIENRPNYVRSWDQVFIYPQALTALQKIRESNYKIVIVTNQSAIGRNLLSFNTAKEINNHLVSEIENNGGRIDGIFMCPHAPDYGCQCRKPNPGLIFKAANSLSIDLPNSVMIGDALTDLMAGQSAGLKHTILVLTGRGSTQFHSQDIHNLKTFKVYDTLLKAFAAMLLE